jgi:iron complex outermembrane receptor protein
MQERQALDTTFQFRPTENFEFDLHVLKLKLGADSTGANMYIQTDTNWGEGDSFCKQFNKAGVCQLSVTPQDKASRVFFQNWARTGEMTSDTYEFNSKYEGDGFVVSTTIGKTQAEGGTQMTANFGYGWWGDNFNAVKWYGTVDARGKQVQLDGADMSFTRDQLDTTVGTSTWTGTRGPNEDSETYAQVDFDLDLDFEIINKFEAGLRTTSHEFVRSEYRAVYSDKYENSFQTSDLYSGTMPLGYQGWTIPKANLGAMIQATNSLVDEFVYSRPAFGQIEEDNLSAYAMFSYEGENYRGNFGVRYVSTEVTSSGHIIDNSPADRLGVNAAWSTDIHSEKGDYSEFLPSLNFVYNVSEDIIVRFALGQAITRPNYDTLFLSAISGYPDDRKGNEQITYGNPALKPMKSTQADVSVEYYYGDGNLVSATLFTKDISDFIVGTTQANQQIGEINNDLADAENGVSFR